jgi:hypothetical protein
MFMQRRKAVEFGIISVRKVSKVCLCEILRISQALKWIRRDINLIFASQALCGSIIYIALSRLLLLLYGPRWKSFATTHRALALVSFTWLAIVLVNVIWIETRVSSPLE